MDNSFMFLAGVLYQLRMKCVRMKFNYEELTLTQNVE